MKRIKLINGDEYDCFCNRRIYCYLARSGVAKAIKRRYRKRFRQKEKLVLDTDLESCYTAEVKRFIYERGIL